MAGRARHCIRDRRAHETSEEHAARDLAAERRARRAELQRRRRLRERESTDPELVAKRQALAERARQYIRDRRAQETPEEHAARLAARRAVRPAQYRALVNAETAEQRARRLEAARMAKRDSRRRRAQQKALQREPAAMIFNGKVTNEPFGYAGAVCAHPGPDVMNAKKKELFTGAWNPSTNFPFKPTGPRNLKFRHQWLQRWNWLVYSKAENWAFCKYCVLFSPVSVDDTTGKLLLLKFDSWKKAIDVFNEHKNKTFHKDRVLDADQFAKTLRPV